MARKAKKDLFQIGQDSALQVLQEIDEALAKQLAEIFHHHQDFSDEDVRKDFITTMQFREIVEDWYFSTATHEIQEFFGKLVTEDK